MRVGGAPLGWAATVLGSSCGTTAALTLGAPFGCAPGALAALAADAIALVTAASARSRSSAARTSRLSFTIIQPIVDATAANVTPAMT